MHKSKIDNANNLLKHIFKYLKIIKSETYSYDLKWSVYNTIHHKYCIPYFLKGEDKYPSYDSSMKTILSQLRLIIVDLFFSLVSLLSIFIILLRRKKIVAIWTGDFYSKVAKGDFRLGKLYSLLFQNKINFVEFVRRDANGFIHAIRNLFLRRRPVIYYSSLENIVTLYQKPKIEIHYSGLLNIDLLLIKKLIRENISDKKKINFFRKLFRLLKTDKFVCWEFSDRQANLIFASKIEKIKTIGFMHGAGMKNYMVHEFIESSDQKRKIGPDVMGVWSQWWKDYYKKNSNIYDRIDICGEINKTKIQPIISKKRLEKVLWISEPLINPSEVIQYIDYLNCNYNLYLKIRPSTEDTFYKSLKHNYPHLKKISCIKGDIYEAISNCDLIIGSHSTAVLNASKLNKNFLLVNTSKWGNYFQLSDEMFVENIDDLKTKIRQLQNQNLNKIKSKFFGEDDLDGSRWLINQITN